MRFHAALSDDESTAAAADQVINAAGDALGGRVDLAFIFFTAHHASEADDLVERLWLELDPQCVVGCSAEGVIGPDREIERAPGIALLAGDAPGVRAHPFHVPRDEWRAILSDDAMLAERLALGERTRALIGFGDPFSTPITQWLARLDDRAPGVPLIGGMASGGRALGENVLVRNDGTYADGFVGVSLCDDVDVETVVSQGCRPIGRPFVVTRAHDNVIHQLGGRPALAVLHETLESLSPADERLLRQGLLIGRAMSEYRDRFGRGDFVVRNVVDIDQDKGALAVGDYVRVGQTIQFHVRDATTASEDLTQLLDLQKLGDPARGGLLFSCNGRGTKLFDEPCHDITRARRAMPDTPLAGFFAAGELGPVGGKNIAHGHTASFALFRPRKS